ncbi:uncharacterized protein LOC21408653 [Morus notabilis]|uniref:uncharacterized protein LOC21408653 n=1 Tax=Morus notabilis TaxID=981085 RepID=UPI000CED356D|nr:uncharacterized protein LOC21408653 [Morus notabilis]
MAADVQVKAESAWKIKYSKLEEKRNALRQAVKLLELQIDKIQAQSKKVCEKERARADFEKEGKAKESAARVALENEVAVLKSQILSLEHKGGTNVQESNGDVKVLQARVSELEKEMNHLEEVVQKERKRADFEKKNVQLEKKIAAEAQKAVEDERIKAEKERNVANLEKDRAGKYRLQMEVLRKEADETKSKLASRTMKLEEANKKLEAEKQKVVKEKKRADSEKAKAEEQRKLAEANMKKVVEGRIHAQSLSRQLEENKTRIEEVCESKLVLELSAKLEEANRRFQLEKEKASREKERADAEMLKVLKQNEVAEVNRKKSLEEKSRADQLSRQLEEYEQKTSELEKQIQELLSNRNSVKASAGSISESTESKFLKKQLKLEKMKKKHAKQVADLERSRNSILQQEVGRLKLEFDQFSCRLDMLHKSFSPRTEGTEGLGKMGRNMPRADMKKLCSSEPFRMQLQSLNGLLKPSCQALDFSGTFRETLQHTGHLCPVPGGNCIEPITGIDSKLESLLGGSPRTILKSSAINSSTTSLSDGQLVGSQDKGAFSVATSVKLAEEYAQPTLTDLSDEVTRMRSSENLAVVAENSVRSPLSNGDVGKGTMHSRKRKRMVDTVETIEDLYFEDKKLHLQIEEKLADLHGMLNKQIDKPLRGGKFLLPSSHGTSYSKHDKLQKKRKSSFQEKVVRQHATDSNEQNRRDEVEPEGHENANCRRQASVTGNDHTWTSGEIGEGIRNSNTSDVDIMAGFDNLADVDFMNLLNLDNPADEEYYRLAMEMPLSPLLPEIEIEDTERFNVEKTIPLVKETLWGGLSNKEEKVFPSGRFNVIETGICFNKSMSDSCATFTNSLVHKNENHVNSSYTVGNDLHTGKVVNASGCLIGESGVEVGRSNETISGDEKVQCPFEGELGSVGNNILEQGVVFSNILDRSSISRIYHAIRTCKTCCSLATQARWMMRDILLALKMEEKLSTKEKVCALFSLLMVNFPVAALSEFGNYINWVSIPCLDSFAGHVQLVMSDVEIRSFFAEVGYLDELLSLIENFLMDGCVKFSNDVPFGSWVESDSRVNIPLDGSKITFSSEPASAEQLVAGSIILASICVTLGQIGFICEASYNILRASKFGNSLKLAILHMFAYLGGDKFLKFSDYSLLMTTSKSLVRNLEELSLLGASVSSIPPVNDPQTAFCPCIKCPFLEEGVSVDSTTSLLLEKIKNAILEAMHQPAVDPVYRPHEMDSDGTCCLNKYGISGNQSDPQTNVTLSSLSDLLALVELVAWHMGWEWTCVKIVPQLLKLLESCVFENSIAGIVILLGQLGRLGVEAFGYEDRQVEQLRCDLSSFFRLSITKKAGLPIQLAIVTALLGLLSVDFETIIQTSEKLPAIVSESVAADLLRKWFSSLNKKQKGLSFNVLQTGGVNKKRDAFMML